MVLLTESGAGRSSSKYEVRRYMKCVSVYLYVCVCLCVSLFVRECVKRAHMCETVGIPLR